MKTMQRSKLAGSIITALLTIAFYVLITGFSQSLTVKGTVKGKYHNTLIRGCTVTVEGTSRQTTTDRSGKYSIKADLGEVLVFSYMGHKQQKRKVISAEMHIELEENFIDLEECVPLVESRADIAYANYSEGKSLRRRIISPIPIGFSPSYDQANNEEYSSIAENGFKQVTETPLSTFSVDVDAASYSNMRRFINKGELPPADALRTEELINYFSYDYPKPTGIDPVKITMESGICPWNQAHKLVRIGIKAKEIPSENLPASNLVFLIDVSGSMYGPTRLELVKSSLKLLVNNLRDKDNVSIVVYAGAAGLKLEATPGSDKQKIREAIDELTSGGSTAGGEGIQLAYKVAKKNFMPKGNNRIILCTDGDFNVGVSSVSGLEKLIEKERKSGVFLTVLGYGMGNYKDNRIQTLAEKGNGNHAYIDNLQEANRVLVNEFGATLHTVAKDVKLQVEFNPSQVQAYRLIGYESRLLRDEDFNNDAKDAGDLGAGHTVTAFYEIIPAGVKNDYIGKVDALKYQQTEKKTVAATGSKELLTIKLRYKDPDKDTSKKLEQVLPNTLNKPVSSDFHFASSVAMFGQLLRDSDYKGDADYKKVINLAKKGLDNDAKGYRREFIRLVEAAEGISN